MTHTWFYRAPPAKMQNRRNQKALLRDSRSCMCFDLPSSQWLIKELYNSVYLPLSNEKDYSQSNFKMDKIIYLLMIAGSSIAKAEDPWDQSNKDIVEVNEQYSKNEIQKLSYFTQIPPIWYDNDNTTDYYKERRELAMLVSAFAFGFIAGLAIYFIGFLMCCPSSREDQYSDENEIATGETNVKRGSRNSSTFSEYYVQHL